MYSLTVSSLVLRSAHVHCTIKMDVDDASGDIFSDNNEKYLPDLPNEKNGELLVFEQKVFCRNEVFNRIHQDIINRHLSDECNRYYPKSASNNRNAYKMKCRNYIYDKAKNILYKKVKHSDGMSK